MQISTNNKFTICVIICLIFFYMICVIFQHFFLKDLPENSSTPMIASQPEGTVLSQYARFFTEDDWEYTTRNRFRISNRVVLLLDRISQSGKKVRGEKATLLINPGTQGLLEGNQKEKDASPIKIQNVGGTEVYLQNEISITDLFNSNSNRLESGILNGKTKITYTTKINGIPIEYLIQTGKLVCDLETLQSSEPVYFRFGPIQAEADYLKVIFETPLGTDELFTGIRSIELGELKHITLHLTPMMFQMMDFHISDELKERLNFLMGKKMEILVTLTCKGPVVYDVTTGLLSLSQNVQIQCNYPDQQNDYLTCGEIQIKISDVLQHLLGKKVDSGNENSEIYANESPNELSSETSPQEKTVEDKTSHTSLLPIDYIQAIQNVRVNFSTFNHFILAPSTGNMVEKSCMLEAENLKFDSGNRKLQISGNQQVAIYYGLHEFHAYEISYTFPAENTQQLGIIENDSRSAWFGTFNSDSNGVISAYDVNARRLPVDHALVVHWDGHLNGTPIGNGYYDIKVDGGVEVRSPIFNLKAMAVSARLRPRTEVDNSKDAAIIRQGWELYQQNWSTKTIKFLPEILFAEGKIELNAYQTDFNLNGNFNRIEFSFRKPNQLPDGLKTAIKKRLTQERNTQNSVSLIPGSNLAAQGPYQRKANEPEKENKKFILSAEKFTSVIDLLPGSVPFYISEATLSGSQNGNVTLNEEVPLDSSKQNKQNISLQAKAVFLHDVLPETLQCEIQGENAVLTGFGTRLESARMILNCAANRIDIPGTGKLSIYTQQKASSDLNYMTLMETNFTWEKYFMFDGKKIEAYGHILVQNPSVSLNSGRVHATFKEPIELTKPPKIENNQPEYVMALLQDISADGKVDLVVKNYEREILDKVFALQVTQLRFYPDTKIVNGDGPGNMRCTFPESVLKTGFKNGNEIQNKMVEQNSEKIEYQVLTDFSKGITAKLQDGEITVTGKISVYSQPVPDWQYQLPTTKVEQKNMKENTYRFTADEMTLGQIPILHDDYSFEKKDLSEIELQAKGNIRFFNKEFTITGNELKYVHLKNNCKILGNSIIPLKVFHQNEVGGIRRQGSGTEIEINIKTKNIVGGNVTFEAAL